MQYGEIRDFQPSICSGLYLNFWSQCPGTGRRQILVLVLFLTWNEGEFLGQEEAEHPLLNLPVDGVDARRLHLDQQLPFLRRRDRHFHMLKIWKSTSSNLIRIQKQTRSICSVLVNCNYQLVMLVFLPWGLLVLRRTYRTAQLSSSLEQRRQRQPWLRRTARNTERERERGDGKAGDFGGLCGDVDVDMVGVVDGSEPLL